MASQLSSGDLISERYASALYDLAAEKKIVDSVLKDLELLQKCIQESEDLKLLVKSPLIASSDKLNIFEKILSKQKADEPYQYLFQSYFKQQTICKIIFNYFTIYEY